MNKVGIFSGSFDPVHHGHVQFALSCVEQGVLDKVIFLPEVEPRGKKPADIHHRLDMLRLAIESFSDWLEIGEVSQSRIDLKDSLVELQTKYQPIYFLFGSDVFLKMNANTWPGLEAFLKRYDILLALRSQDSSKLLEEHAFKIGARVKNIDTLHKLHTSSEVRRISNLSASDLHTLVDLPVAKYIKEQNLY